MKFSIFFFHFGVTPSFFVFHGSSFLSLALIVFTAVCEYLKYGVALVG